MVIMRDFSIINVMAASLDGYVALHGLQTDADRHATGFSNHEDWDHLLKLIQSCDAVVLGSTTLQAGGGVIDQARPDGTYPEWITLTRRGIPDEHIFWSQDYAPRAVISSDPLTLPPHAGTVTALHGEDPLVVLSEFLKSRHHRRVLLFGGGQINKLFYDAGLVDELILTVCPVLVARQGAVPLVTPGTAGGPLTRFRLLEAQPQGNLLFLHYEVLRASPSDI
jgi:5-amino-6-(5-phosphoribosylamino)uracil reductase